MLRGRRGIRAALSLHHRLMPGAEQEVGERLDDYLMGSAVGSADT